MEARGPTKRSDLQGAEPTEGFWLQGSNHPVWPINPSNIAEGMDRTSSKEKIRFLDIAKGSCAELRTQTYIGIEVGYIDNKTGQHWVRESKEISAMLIGLMRVLKKSRQ